LSLLGAFAAGCASGRSLPAGPALVHALDPPSPWSAPVDAQRPVEARLPVDVPLTRKVFPSSGLSYNDAALAALALNPRLRAIRAQRGVAHAQIVQAGILPNPEFGGSLDIPTDGSLAGTGKGYSAWLAWAITPLISRHAAVSAERKNLSAVELDIAWQEWQVVQAARLGVVRLAELQLLLSIARETAAALEAKVAAIQGAVKTGDATVLELSSAQSTLQAASLEVLQLVQAQRVTRLAWLRAIGVPPTSYLDVSAKPGLPDYRTLPDLQALLDALPEHRFDLVGLRKGYDAQDARVRAAALNGFPPVTVGINRAVDTGKVGTVGFAVTIGLPVLDRNQGNRKLAAATREQLQGAYLSRVQQARSEVATAYANLRSVQEQLALVRASVPTLEELVTVSEQMVGGGNVNIVNLYDLKLRLLNAQLLAERLHQNELELGVALELAACVSLGSIVEEIP